MRSADAKLIRNTMPKLARRLYLLIILSAFALSPVAPAFAQNALTAPPISADADKLLHRMFASTDFEVRNFGPARWLDGGDFYTTVERSADSKDAQEIVRYETATGKREVFVSAAKLIPAGAKTPLAIEDSSWSKDKSRLLIYTNSAPAWRQNTRGDYWVLELKSGTLRKLGGDAPPSSLMFAKFSPDGTKVAYVRAKHILFGV